MLHPLHLFKYCPKCGGSFVENDFKSKRCCDCGFVYYLNPAAATVGVVVNANGEVLVARRAKEPAKGTLDLPGGFCDCYESVEQGIAREIEEETGLKVKETNYLFSIPNIYSYSGMDIHTMDLFFRCTVEGGTPVPNDDVAELEWIAIDKLKSEEFGLISIRKGVEILKVLKKNKL